MENPPSFIFANLIVIRITIAGTNYVIQHNFQLKC